MSSKEITEKKKRRGRRRVYKKLSIKEVEERRKMEICDENSFIRAGNEGLIHMKGKINKAAELWNQYKEEFKRDFDGVWFEYPIIDHSSTQLNSYQKRKLNYLLSLYQKVSSNSAEIKNLHNIFNSNLKSSLRGRKSISSLDIKKIVDIAVVVNGAVVKVVEVISKNKLTTAQKESLENIAKCGGFLFEEYKL